MEELLSELPEDPLGGRVARAAALRTHGSGQPMARADSDPSGATGSGSPGPSG